MTQQRHSTTVRRMVTADRARIFGAFKTAAALEQWFSPAPDITLDVLQFEFAVGGRYRIRYAMPDGSHPTLGGTFDLIQPPEKLSFTWVWEAPDPHADIPTRVTIDLIEQNNATEVVLTHEQIPTREIAARHAAGWEATLDHLQQVLKDETDLPDQQ
ncbi:MAG: SRPBCC domain-containing protein [Stappiaceae bacterium]